MNIFRRQAPPGFKLLLSVCLLAWSASVATADAATDVKPRLTQAQAIGIAQTFCRHIGEPVTNTGTAQFPAPMRFAAGPDYHWQPHWLVVFPDQAELDVVDATGVVSYYENNYLAQQTSIRGHIPAGAAISKAEAVERATVALRATGQKGELMFRIATLQQFGVPPTAGTHIWFIAWQRQFHDIPYRFEGLNIQLDAETGAIKGLCLNFPSPPLTRALMNISHDQAAAIAQASVAGSGDHNAVLELVRTEIVQSRTPGQHTGGIVPASTMRPVWVCVYAVERGKREIKVDTETGEIVGDISYGSRGGRFNGLFKAKSPAATADPKATIPPSTTHS